MTKEEIQSIFGSRIVSFHAVFARAIGSVPAAVMLSQAFFWQEKAKSKDGVKIGEEMFFSKTGEEWYDETGLTESQQLTARKHLLSAGFWVEQRAGLPAKMCYRIDIETLVAVISRYLKTGQQVAIDNRKQSREITRTSSGKFRQLEAEKNGNNIKVESKRELNREGKGEEKENAQNALAPPFTPAGTIQLPETNIPLNAEKKANDFTGPTPPQEFIVTTHTPQAPYIRVVEKVEIHDAPGPKSPGEKIRELCAVNYKIREGFTMSRKIPGGKFDEYLQAFDAEQAAMPIPKTYRSDNDLVAHFLNFSGVRWSVEQRATPARNGGRGAQLQNSGSDLSKYDQPQKF